MSNVNSTLTIIMLNVTGLNTPIKRWTLAGWIKKMNKPYAVYKRHVLDSKTQTGSK